MAADVELLRAGWVPMPAMAVLCWPTRDAGPEYEWTSPVGTIDIVELKATPSLPELLEEMYSEGRQRASSDRLLKLLDALFVLTGRKQFTQIEWLLRNSSLQRLAPEFAVGILRATANYRRSIPSWLEFREATRSELGRRDLNADQILIGLGGEAATVG